MPVISFDIPNAFYVRYIEAVCADYGYNTDMTNPDGSPMSRQQFARRTVMHHWYRQVTANYEANLAAAAARTAKTDEINSVTIS